MPTKAKQKAEPLAVSLGDAPPIVLPVRLSEGGSRMGRGLVLGADGRLIAESPELAWAERIIDALTAVGNTSPAALQADDPRQTLVVRTCAALGKLVEMLRGGLPAKSDTGQRYQVVRAVQEADDIMAAWEGRKERPWKPTPPLFRGVIPDPAMKTPIDEPAPECISLPQPAAWPNDLAGWELCSLRSQPGFLLRHDAYGATAPCDTVRESQQAARRLLGTSSVPEATADQAQSVAELPAPRGSLWGRAHDGSRVHLWREDATRKNRVYVGVSVEWHPSREAWCGVVVAAERPIVPQPNALITGCCPACVSALQHFLQTPDEPQVQLRALAPDLASGWTASRDDAGRVKLEWNGEGYSTAPHSDLADAVREARQIIASQDDPTAQEWAEDCGEPDEEPEEDEGPEEGEPGDKGSATNEARLDAEDTPAPLQPTKREARWGNKRAGDRQHWFVPGEAAWRSACIQITTPHEPLSCPHQPRCARCEAALEREPATPDPCIPAPTGFHWEQQGERWRLAHANGYRTDSHHDPQRAVNQAERWLLSQPQPHTPNTEDFPTESTYWNDGWRLIRDPDTRRWSVRHSSGLATEPSTKRSTALKTLPALDAARQQLAGWQITLDTANAGWRATRGATIITAPTIQALAEQVQTSEAHPTPL